MELELACLDELNGMDGRVEGLGIIMHCMSCGDGDGGVFVLLFFFFVG